MRPIKFRYVYKDLDGGIVIYHFTLKQIESWNVWETLDCCWSHSYELLGIDQFTWLFDKNGKEIHRGDIVKRDDKSNGKWWRFAVVEIDPDIQFNCSSIKEVDGIKNSSDYTFRYWQFAYKDTENHLTIIGNIYENPELVNV